MCIIITAMDNCNTIQDIHSKVTVYASPTYDDPYKAGSVTFQEVNMISNSNDQQNTRTILRVALLTLAASFIYAMYAGIRNNYGIMLNSIVDSAGLSFTSVSFVLAVGQLIFGMVQPAFGVLSAKRGNIYAFVSGVVLTIAGMLLTPLCKSSVSLMICLGIILPAGTGAISYGLLMGSITPRIPPKTVAFVSGIVNASSGISNIVLSPVINSLIKTGGLMYSMLVLTIPMALTLPISLSLRKKSEMKGPRQPQPQPQTAKIGIKSQFQKAMKSRSYLFLMIGFFTCGFHMALITNHLPTQIKSFGFSSEIAAYAFSCYGIVTILGSILSGSLCGKLKMKNVLGFYYGLRPITILLFLILPKTVFTVTFFTALLGFSGASTVPPVSGIIGKLFGAGSLATLYGLVFLVHQVGGFFGAFLGGICFDATGSYAGIWVVSIVFSTAASAISFAIDANPTPSLDPDSMSA